jgi:hypothetical protein
VALLTDHDKTTLSPSLTDGLSLVKVSMVGLGGMGELHATVAAKNASTSVMRAWRAPSCPVRALR